MSLINKLLNDLETRQAYKNEDQDNILNGLSSSHEFTPDDSDFSWALPVIKLSIPVLFLTFGIYQLQAHSTYLNSSAVKNFAASIFRDSTSEPKSDTYSNIELFQLDSDLDFVQMKNSELTLPENRLHAIEFKQNDEGIELFLTLSEATAYHVYTMEAPTRVIIELDRSALSFPLEQLEPANPFYKVRAEQLNNNKLRLTLESEVELDINTISSNKTEDSHKLVVSVWHDRTANPKSREKYQSSQEIAVASDHKDDNPGGNTIYKGDVVKTPVTNADVSVVEEIYSQAYEDYRKQRYVESITQLQALLEIDAMHVKARSTLALIYYQQGDALSAMKLLNEGLIQQPDQAEWLTLTAKIYLQEGKLVEAARQLDMHSPPMSEHTDYYAIKAAIQQRIGNHEIAARLYRDLLQLKEVNAAWWMGLGISLEALERYSDALFAYQQAMNNQTLAGQPRAFVQERYNNLTAMMNDKSS